MGSNVSWVVAAYVAAPAMALLARGSAVRGAPEDRADRLHGRGEEPFANVRAYQQLRNPLAESRQGLSFLQKAARDCRNVFEALMDAVKTYSLGQISHALYDVGGEYRRDM